MKAKIRVYGRSQSRTALGIINAYLKLYPDSELSDLQQAFPRSLNPKGFTDNLIVPEKETKGHEKLFFEKESELIVLKNGERLALVEVWGKDSFNAICEHAKQYGIEVAGLEGSGPFEKGSYELEYLGESVTPPPPEIEPVQENACKEKCKFGWLRIILLILAILLLLILLFCHKRCCCSGDRCLNPGIAAAENDKQIKEAPDEDITAVAEDIAKASDIAEDDTDTGSSTNNLVSDTGDAISITLPDGKEWKIEKNTPEYKLFAFLNSDEAEVDASDETKGRITLDKLHFERGKTNITSESENQLKNIAAIMKFFPNSHIEIAGHTDNTGQDDVNMRVSSERAKNTGLKLIASGVEASRITYEGYGSRFPVCTEDSDPCRTANRRIDVKVTQK